MSRIEMPSSFSPFNGGALHVCLAGESVDLLPLDTRAQLSYSLVTRPGGSSAALSGSTFVADSSGGKYTATVTAGGDTLNVVVWAFVSAVHDGLAKKPTGETRSEDAIRGVLLALSRSLTDAQLNNLNAGVWPSVNLSAYGA